jgi:hypothetical protein
VSRSSKEHSCRRKGQHWPPCGNSFTWRRRPTAISPMDSSPIDVPTITNQRSPQSPTSADEDQNSELARNADELRPAQRWNDAGHQRHSVVTAVPTSKLMALATCSLLTVMRHRESYHHTKIALQSFVQVQCITAESRAILNQPRAICTGHETPSGNSARREPLQHNTPVAPQAL